MASNASSSVKTFPFFRLPRELRDTIYEYCGTELQGGNVEWLDEYVAQAYMEHSRRVNLLLVNKQFADEYEQRQPPAILVVKEIPDLDTVHPMNRPSLLPTAAMSAKAVTLKLLAYFDDLEDSLYASQEFLTGYCRSLFNLDLSRLVCHLFIDRDGGGEVPTSLRDLGEFGVSKNGNPVINLTEIRAAKLEIYAERHDHEPRYSGEKGLYKANGAFVPFTGSWTAAEGWRETDDTAYSSPKKAASDG